MMISADLDENITCNVEPVTGSGPKVEDEEFKNGFDDDTDEEHDAVTRANLKWKKLRDSVRNYRGSILHRNSQRQNHLQKLYLKRRISEHKLHSLTKEMTTPTKMSVLKSQESLEYDAMTVRMSIDEALVSELKAEVDTEMESKKVSAKLKDIHELMDEYQQYFEGYGRYPLEVRLENVSYTAPVDANEIKIMTVYNSSFIYPITKLLRRFFLGEKKIPKQITQLPILSNINLVLKPGKQYLLLGPPRAGKSTLLKLISGLIKPQRGEKLEGKISYNGRTLEDKDEFHIENAFVYIDQLDKHAPRLTVEETFEFAHQCLTGGKFIREKLSEEADLAVKKANEKHLATNLMLVSLGLKDVANTYVGDAVVQGVSGGQRRRVTVGEMLVSGAPVLCGDEISTGLDAASTYDMVQVILHFGKRRQFTRIFSLLQPSPETVSLFDEAIVLAEGHIIYAGPIELVEDYFANIGYKAPEFTDVADFLQMISTEDGAELYDPPPTLRSERPDPPSASELAVMFRNSELGREISAQLKEFSTFVWKKEDKSSLHGVSQISDLAMSEAVRRKYANSFPRSTELIVKRFFTLYVRDRRVIIAGIVKNVLMGVSVGGVFFNTDDPISIQGCLFQAGLFIMLGSMQASSGLIEDRVIFYKHSDANFYSAWPYVFGRVIAQLPQTTFDTFTFGCILYFMVGLANRDSASNFFVYISTLLVFALVMNQQMAVFASFASGGDMLVYSACTLLAMMLFGGFIVVPDAIPRYYQWLYWWNPFSWAYRALVVNEFRCGRWEDPDVLLIDNGFVVSGESPGQIWVSFAFYFMLLWWLICCVATALGLTFVRNIGKKAAPEPQMHASGDKVEQSEKFKIPFTPVTLSFHEICYEVPASTSTDKLMLLKDVNGIFRPGQMCALMGSSGAGKTTLMDVIALRKKSGRVSGEVRLNCWPQEVSSFRRCSGYVEQFDIQSPELTVKETILFSARLRLDQDVVQTDEDRRAFVESVMLNVELTELADVLVGTDETGGLSFEQKKRLSIAVELAASPSIIFLDEPTSGLDARSAALVVSTLRRIADEGRTICATIHQPSSFVFGMFDELLLLKRGGQVVYHGSLHTTGKDCGRLVSYFESRGAPPISLGENPSNWMLRVITSNEMGDLTEAYSKSDDFQSLQQELSEIKNHAVDEMKITYDSKFATTKGRRRDLINRRLSLIYWRSPTYNLARILVSLLLAFILSSVFISTVNLDVLTEVDMRARLSVVFLSFIITGIMAILSVLPVMAKIRDMFYRHRDAGMYDSASLGLALGVAEKWFILLSTALFCIVFLGTSNVDKGVTGLIGFWGFFTFNFAIYSYMGQLFVCLVRSSATAVILSSVFIGLNNFFAGLIVRPQFMVGFYAVPYYLSPSHYVYEGLVVSLYTDDNRQVAASEGSQFYDYLVENNICAAGSTDCIGTVSDYVLVFFDFKFQRENYVRNILILGFVLTLTRILTWVALKKIRFG